MATASVPESLRARVLVLNRLYMAVHVVGVPRAFGLLLGSTGVPDRFHIHQIHRSRLSSFILPLICNSL